MIFHHELIKPPQRRRKDAPGELSKGAVRAQRAAARAKAMREQWMDTNLLLNMQNQTDPRAMAHKHAIARHRAMAVDYTDDPAFMDGFGPAFEDDLYDDGYDLPYDAVLDQFEEELPYPQGPHDIYRAEERFTPIEPHHSMNFASQRNLMQEGYAEDPAFHHSQQGYVPLHPTHLEMPEQPIGFADYADPVYQTGGFHENLAHRNMLSAQAANHQGYPLHQPMLAGYQPGLPEHEEVDYTYQPFDSPPRAQDDFAQVDPFLASLGDDFRPTGRPADIIAGRWAQQAQQDGWIASDDAAVGMMPEQDTTLREPEPILARGHHDGQALGMFSTVDNDILPSEGIDFGEQPRLFDEIWEREPPILPLDPDMEDYQQAVREQDEMEMLTAR